MEDIQIVAPIFTLEGKELLPAGATLNDETIDKLMAANPVSYEGVSLFRHGTVAADIRKCMSNPPYDVFFEDEKHVEQLISLLEELGVIQPVLDMLDYFKIKDFHTYRHLLMVYVLSCLFGKFLIPDFEKHLRDTAGVPTHDFGKINVPLSILTKKGALTRSELAHMRHHTLAGYCLLCYYYKDPQHLAAVVARDHHERLNGQGYPRGSTEINPMVEIVIVSDVYDALLSPRCYRPKTFDNRSAVEIITEMAEKGEISWGIVQLLVSQSRIDKPDFRTVEVSLEKRGHAPEGSVYGIIVDDDEQSA